MPQSRTSKATKSPKSSKTNTKRSSKRGKTADSEGITSAVFEDAYRQENLSREFIRQFTGDNHANLPTSGNLPTSNVPSTNVEVPKAPDLPRTSIASAVNDANSKLDSKLPSGEARISQLPRPSYNGTDLPTHDTVEANLPKSENIPAGVVQKRPSADPTKAAQRKMMHSTLNCHITVDEDPPDRTRVLYGNMNPEQQARVIRHVNKYWDSSKPFASIYPILLKLEREVGPGWRVDKIQTEDCVHSDAVAKSTVNFTVSPDSTMYSIWRQQVPIF